MVQRKCKGEQQGVLLVEVNCIFHLTILRIERSNCFDIINSLCSTGTLNKLKITITSSFCRATLQYFQSMLESYVLTGRFKSSCHRDMYQYSVIITVDTENATINARSTKLCL